MSDKPTPPLPTESNVGLDDEAFAWWRSFIKPIYVEMLKRDVWKMTLERTKDGRLRFELEPAIHPAESVEKGAND